MFTNSLNLLDKLDDACSKAFDEIYRIYCEEKDEYDLLIKPHDQICDCLQALIVLRQNISNNKKMMEDKDFDDLHSHILVLRNKYQLTEDQYQFEEEEYDASF